jgi:hypothetical protein
VQRDLARTLRRIAARGPSEFYTGETADLLVAEMRRGRGIITKQDLARYRPIARQPLRTTYRGFTVVGMPPVSSGGTTSFEILHMLETRDTLPAFGSAAYAHLLGEAERRAFVDRNTKLCDPAFCRVPVAELTSKAYARRLAATIDPARATRTQSLTTLGDHTHTTHYSVVDAAGNAVSTTTTLNLGYGAGVYVAGAGFFLNDEMDDLAAAPGRPNAFGLVEGEQNAVAPGKRPLSSMTPTVVLDTAGRVLLVVGAAGGPTIISGTTQVILNVLDHRMTLADAMRAPRLHHQALPDALMHESNGLAPQAADSLRAMGPRAARRRPDGERERGDARARRLGGGERAALGGGGRRLLSAPRATRDGRGDCRGPSPSRLRPGHASTATCRACAARTGCHRAPSRRPAVPLERRRLVLGTRRARRGRPCRAGRTRGVAPARRLRPPVTASPSFFRTPRPFLYMSPSCHHGRHVAGAAARPYHVSALPSSFCTPGAPAREAAGQLALRAHVAAVGGLAQQRAARAGSLGTPRPCPPSGTAAASTRRRRGRSPAGGTPPPSRASPPARRACRARAASGALRALAHAAAQASDASTPRAAVVAAAARVSQLRVLSSASPFRYASAAGVP